MGAPISLNSIISCISWLREIPNRCANSFSPRSVSRLGDSYAFTNHHYLLTLIQFFLSSLTSYLSIMLVLPQRVPEAGDTKETESMKHAFVIVSR